MISVIIPTYNEAGQVAETIRMIRAAVKGDPVMEIIVSDGGSIDGTVDLATVSGAIVVKSGRKGRAVQMNYGASFARGEILYFLHADCIPPPGFDVKISEACAEGFTSGCFRLGFDYRHWFLRANCWFTRFNVNAVRFGDQSLFVTREVFQKAGGFREDLLIMEDQEIISRIRKYSKFRVLNDVVITSARKYLDNGLYRMQGIFFCIWAMYYLGCSQERLSAVYRRLIRKH